MDSDSEGDSDYVPPKDNDNSDTEARASKRARTQAHQEPTVTENTADKADSKTSDDAYAAFKASLNAPPIQSAQAPPPAETVKITKHYRYAGEDVIEVKEVPADSDEAKKWPRWKPSDDATNAPATSTSAPASHGPGLSSDPVPAPAAGPSAAKPVPAKRAGPRKSKSKLGEIPKKEPVKRLTTLDKSAMDWRAHVEGEPSSAMKDELEANRRGGGYLEKQEFLQRVEARKEEVLDATKGKRRR